MIAREKHVAVVLQVVVKSIFCLFVLNKTERSSEKKCLVSCKKSYCSMFLSSQIYETRIA